ncbi:nicotinamide-nucleotide adenylyltransferase [Marine Group I thaumarchaeote]|uniref:Nicotinamide-nucleotide adenylyltransferase n=1 Tax=Marine Group I thaumarchaeote TaxID=2511932 RepID=A0A7K4NS24_9ARCH|nr:nicotinamide-nucleotide adenylyltransferase [Marine Group I thaumarchaeote]
MDGLLIGRFQPFHLGHLDAVLFGLSRTENLFIGIGSSNKSNEKRNPFSAEERKEMIISSIESSMADRLKIFDIPDVGDHEKWTFEIDKIVPKYDIVFTNDEFTKTLFEKREMNVVPVVLKDREKFSGTNIRELIAGNKNWQDLVPQGTQKVLDNLNAKERLKNL